MTPPRRRYRKVEVHTWADEGFLALSPLEPSGQALWLWLLTGPCTGPIPGVLIAGEAAMAERLHWSREAFSAALDEVLAQEMAHIDATGPLVWLPNGCRYNPPQSLNVVKSWAVTWREVPDCGLKATVWAGLKAFLEGMGEAFAEAFTEACPKPSRKASRKASGMASPKASRKASGMPSPKPCAIQEQEQEQIQLQHRREVGVDVEVEVEVPHPQPDSLPDSPPPAPAEPPPPAEAPRRFLDRVRELAERARGNGQPSRQQEAVGLVLVALHELGVDLGLDDDRLGRRAAAWLGLVGWNAPAVVRRLQVIDASGALETARDPARYVFGAMRHLAVELERGTAGGPPPGVDPEQWAEYERLAGGGNDG